MGPFELMDYIENDVNYKVTEKFLMSFILTKGKPSITQKTS